MWEKMRGLGRWARTSREGALGKGQPVWPCLPPPQVSATQGFAEWDSQGCQARVMHIIKFPQSHLLCAESESAPAAQAGVPLPVPHWKSGFPSAQTPEQKYSRNISLFNNSYSQRELLPASKSQRTLLMVSRHIHINQFYILGLR